ncbi:hypothetical protein F3N43_13750 [Alkalilimnicola sp. S0819]|uniref:hypothetical protein n=1 Tax=Alkalilimnicola sp. S0819 TaxID=2613922 RepID=UPI00132217CB|nr:hypothetical protein [Alkalilimnicola sp. S0819]KAB7619458.1 hypothetical protein F3N43_13750 [Alkalilimnicola sp. S0819]MPQ17701.1 hypothetical protein [Alkalilimnicola sp. S0819]
MLLAVLVAPLHVLATERSPSLAYGLCSENVEKVVLVEETQGTTVRVQLTRKATAEFEAFTEQNIGERIEVVAGRELIFRAITHVVVSSGLLRSGVRSRTEAEGMKQAILHRREADECGVLQSQRR